MNLGDDKSKLLVAKEYVKSVYKNDISRIDGVKRNQKLAHLIMKSYARNISTLAKTTSILADVTAADDVECTRPTLESYVEALEKLFVIQDIEAWCPSIRGRMLDYLFEFADDERILLMYKKVCRRFVYDYPETISYYIMEYRKEYDRESLIGTEYEYLLHEDDELFDKEHKTKQ